MFSGPPARSGQASPSLSFGLLPPAELPRRRRSGGGHVRQDPHAHPYPGRARTGRPDAQPAPDDQGCSGSAAFRGCYHPGRIHRRRPVTSTIVRGCSPRGVNRAGRRVGRVGDREDQRCVSWRHPPPELSAAVHPCSVASTGVLPRFPRHQRPLPESAPGPQGVERRQQAQTPRRCSHRLHPQTPLTFRHEGRPAGPLRLGVRLATESAGRAS